jgi:TolB protein
MLDGSQLQRLTRSAQNEFQPAWSPDGKRIVFRAAPAGLPGTSSLADIVVVNADGTGRKNLTNNPRRGNWDPAWSPNGKLIAFGSAGPDVWTMRPDGKRLRRLTRGGGESPAWSPDGKRIAFMSSRTTGQYDIYVMSATGSKVRRLTSSPEEDGYPDWSPDGKTIAFSTGPPQGKWSIWLMDADGSNKRVLVSFADGESAGFPNWSPDGRRIIFSTYTKTGSSAIYVVDADGSNLTTTKIVKGDMPVWQPRSRLLSFKEGFTAPDPVPQDGTSLILSTFERYPIVALGEIHGSRAEHELIARLMRKPEFARDVGNVVVEFGNGRYQRLADDYLGGKPVSLARLSRIWTQTTQRDTGVWDNPVYSAFFRTVRQINMRSGQPKIRVLLGDPPIDWSKIRGTCNKPRTDWRRPRCLDYWLQRRDSFFAAQATKILRRGDKALLLAGDAHFYHTKQRASVADDTVGLINRARPDSVFVITPYQGFPVAPLAQETVSRWPPGSIALLEGTRLGEMTMEQLFGPPPPPQPGNVAGGYDESKDQFGQRYDALLYLGPSSPASGLPDRRSDAIAGLPACHSGHATRTVAKRIVIEDAPASRRSPLRFARCVAGRVHSSMTSVASTTGFRSAGS